MQARKRNPIRPACLISASALQGAEDFSLPSRADPPVRRNDNRVFLFQTCEKAIISCSSSACWGRKQG